MNKESLLPIGELSRLTGVHIKSLRYYDRIGILRPSYVEPGSGYRYYAIHQLPVLETIRLCTGLGIPLREFQEYYDAESHRLHYAKLFARGEALEREKLCALQKRMAALNRLQFELCRSEQVCRSRRNIQCRLYAADLWLEPALPDGAAETEPAQRHRLMHEASQKGCQRRGPVGRLLLCGKRRQKLYFYMEIEPPAPGRPLPSNVLHLPEGDYLCRRVEGVSIWDAERVFPGPFASDAEKVVMESALLTEDYNTESPVYELRCSLFRPRTELL